MVVKGKDAIQGTYRLLDTTKVCKKVLIKGGKLKEGRRGAPAVWEGGISDPGGSAAYTRKKIPPVVTLGRELEGFLLATGVCHR